MPKHNFNEMSANQKDIQTKMRVLIPVSVVNLILGISALYLILG